VKAGAGRTGLSRASSKGYPAIVNLLQQAGAREEC
jgi:hypothetical protein